MGSSFWSRQRRRTREASDHEPAPSWSGPPAGTRILVEHPDPTVRDILQRDLTAEGFDVLTCGGPRPAGDGATSCPLLRQEHCPAVTDADVVVSGLALNDHVSRMVLRRITRTSTPPLILAAPAHVIDEYAEGIPAHHLFPLETREVTRMVDELT